jgi:hypothetical protein
MAATKLWRCQLCSRDERAENPKRCRATRRDVLEVRDDGELVSVRDEGR